MRKQALQLILALGIVFVFQAPAHATINWTWNVNQTVYSAMPGDSVIFHASLENLVTSDENITFDNILSNWGSGSMSWNGVKLDNYVFGTLTPVNKNFSNQFAGINLAPGGTWDFDFAQWFLAGDAPSGTFYPEFGLNVHPTGLDGYYFQTRTFTFIVNTTTSPVPIPAAVWLFGTGLLGLFGVRRKISK
jgi:hypothetical protein